MKRYSRVFRWIFGITLLATVMIGLIPTSSEAEIYDKIIRLHVLANSDSESDQALKLTVRDALLVEAARLTEHCQNRKEAEVILTAEAESLQRIAEETLRNQGCDYPVAVRIGQETYPTRAYEGLRLPAGEYCSLRVMIGEATGQNWWCVLFPPLCVGTAAQVKEEMVSAGFTPGQVKILTDSESPRYVLKFKLLEILGALFS